MRGRLLVLATIIYFAAGVGMVLGLYEAILAYGYGRTFPFWIYAVGTVSAILWGNLGVLLVGLASPLRYRDRSAVPDSAEDGGSTR